VEPLPEVEAVRGPGRVAPIAVLALVLIGAVASGALAAGAPPGAPDLRVAASPTPVNGTIQGPDVLGLSATGSYYINGSGGPAYAADGTKIGNLSYYASVAGPNTTGVVFAPTRNNITNFVSPVANLTVTDLVQTLTIDVMISSTYNQTNDSINFTYTVHVVQPYVVAATLVDRSSANLLAFSVNVTLDGTRIGIVQVPSISAGGTYALSFSYVTLGLSSGWHTFSISLVAEKGLVTFSNGSLIYTESIYVPPPTPNYDLWYLVGIVAFIGVLFIWATRVAARRRGVARR
jgi:hypothetical protein